MRTSETTGKLFAAIAAAQAEMPAVTKEATNPHFKSKYATLDAVHAVAQPILAKHGVALLALTGAEDDCAVTEVRVQVGDEWLESTIYMKPRSLDPQQIGSCNTYARRYLYGMLFGLVTEAEDDGNYTRPQGPQTRHKPVAPPPYKADITEATIAQIKALQWKHSDCMACWEKNATPEAFRAAVAMESEKVEQLPMD